VRETLEATKDAEILAAAGSYLVSNARNAKVAFDHHALGRRYLERAVQLDPQSSEKRRTLEAAADLERGQPQFVPFGTAPRETWPDLLAKSSNEERLLRLAAAAELEYMSGENYKHVGRQPEALNAFERSERYAREALALAPSLSSHPTYPDALFRGHIAVGLSALRNGDRRTAVEHLLEAAKVPPSTGRSQPPRSLEYRLVNYLLKDGERTAVIDYLERAAPQRDADERAAMMKTAAAIRSGRMPEHYQRLLASGHL
jgi:tetratricopeptide (TPR) repeat protein